ncbi:AAA family ATPase [Polaromonas sp.]|nr:AAA family ATPase [Candidatus Saccharibacteria bacterium]
MPLLYITGPSGAGKSTVASELIRRGYQAYDADKHLCVWFNNETGKQVDYPHNKRDRGDEWQQHHSIKMVKERVATIARNAGNDVVFICGIAPNDLEVAKEYFDKVVCLLIDKQLMIKRVTTRDNNTYGHDSDQLNIMQQWYDRTVNKYQDHGAVMIDASKPINEVVDRVLNESKSI